MAILFRFVKQLILISVVTAIKVNKFQKLFFSSKKIALALKIQVCLLFEFVDLSSNPILCR